MQFLFQVANCQSKIETNWINPLLSEKYFAYENDRIITAVQHLHDVCLVWSFKGKRDTSLESRASELGYSIFWILPDGTCQQVRICQWMERISAKSYTRDHYIGRVFGICSILFEWAFWKEISGEFFIYYGSGILCLQKIKEALRERSAFV